MKITITGSLGNIGQRLTSQLTAKGHEVTVISHSPERAAAITALGAIPAIGQVNDPAFLQRAFTGADAVFTMIPPHYTDVINYMKTVGDHYATAIATTGVKYVVNLSAIGAHLPDGPGPTKGNYYVEQRLNALSDVHVLHLRPGMFYTNFYGAIPMIMHQHIIGNNFGADVKMVLSHPRDIANAAATALDTLSFSGKSVRYVAGDEKSGAEIADILGRAINKPALSWIAFPDEALLQGMMQSGMSEEMAKVYMIEIGVALREGGLFDDYRRHENDAYGNIGLEEFAGEFAAAYASHQ
ncbi:NAD(P)H-binding protein [Chitinophaga filiformis]|uniref:NmrA family NAD(P)-binding protein n=1 Tax=Chitinophaga filiformis TaxID=104663 RepID=UPI001F2357D3|nr:NAD(P)H-binding protein [Chitinophaga filiformis]MCF6405005.1 NAD(P)H-binding protein [Chitinophaga filiformis]